MIDYSLESVRINIVYVWDPYRYSHSGTWPAGDRSAGETALSESKPPQK